MAQTRVRPASRPIFSILGDQPAEAGEDRLGFDRFAETLAGRLLTSVQHTPFTVGIVGDWGQGKTTVMKMLQARLQQAGCPTIWFEPWKYNQREGVWKGLALTLVREVRAQDSLLQELRRKQGAMKNWLGGFLWSRLIGDAWGEKLVQAATSEPWSAASLHQMEATLDGLFELVDPAEQGNPVVLFVDDLDRCLPEAARSVLEAVKLVLARRGLITVLGLAEGELARAIQAAYTESLKGSPDELDPDWGRKYIGKIIQMPFPMPQISAASFESYVGHCLDTCGVGALLDDRSEWRPILREACGDNLREVKRFLNHFISEMDKAAANLETLRDEGRTPDTDVTANPARVLFVLLLAWRFRDFYRTVRRGAQQDLLIRAQLAFTSELPEDKAAEMLRFGDLEFHRDAALADFFRLCLRGADGVRPLVPEFRGRKDLLPYLQFGLLPAAEEEGEQEVPRGATRGAEIKRPASSRRQPEAVETQEEVQPRQPESREEPVSLGVSGDATRRSKGKIEEAPKVGPPAAPHSDALLAADAAQGLLGSGRPAEAEHRLQRAVRRAEAAGDAAGEALLRRQLATAFQELGKNEEAIEALLLSVERSTEMGDPDSELESRGLLAQAFRLAGYLDRALEEAQRAEELAVDLGDPYILSGALAEQAEVLERQERYEEAAEYRERVLEVVEPLAQPTLKGEALVKLGANLLNQGRLEAAESDLRQAVEVGQEIGMADLEATARALLAESYQRQGDLKAAMEEQQLAVDLRTRAGDLPGQVSAALGLAGMLAADDREIAAGQVLKKLWEDRQSDLFAVEPELLQELGSSLINHGEGEGGHLLLVEAARRLESRGEDEVPTYEQES